MPLPDPRPGLVIRYAYLWRDERLRQQEEGVKDRPCMVILAIRKDGGDPIVTVAPITHSVPPKNSRAVEVPADTKRRLGLDDARSWIVTNDLNEFVWPGPDLRAIGQQTSGRFAYGLVPRGIFDDVKAAVLEHIRERRLYVSRRT